MADGNQPLYIKVVALQHYGSNKKLRPHSTADIKPYLPVKPQDLAPCKCRLPSFNGPVPSAALNKEVFIFALDIITVLLLFVNCYFLVFLSMGESFL